MSNLSRTVSEDLDRCSRLRLATRSCRLVLLLSVCSSVLIGGLLLASRHRFMGSPMRAWSSNGNGKHGKGPRVCLVYDGARAEPGLTASLAELLSALVRTERAEVTALRLDDESSRPDLGLPDALAACVGIKWVALPRTEHRYDGSAAAAVSFRALEWLRGLSHPYDHVIFHSAGGAGHYPLLARELGLALTSTRVSVMSLAPRQLLWRRHPGMGASLEELEEDHMQRGVAQRADVLVATTASLRFMRAQSWQLPPLSAAWDVNPRKAAAAAELAADNEGSASMVDDDRTADDDDDGLVFHRAPRLIELWASLPKRDHQRHGGPALPGQTTASDASAEELSRRLRTMGSEDQRAPNGSATPPLQLSVAGVPAAVSGGMGASHGGPLVSVCVVHHERGPLLLQALESIRQQTLPARNVQAVVVDDGSTSTKALTTLEKLSNWAEFRSGRWLLLRRPSRYLGAARNEAARYARGRYLYFLDDDNCLKRYALSTLLWAAAASHAHILTSVNEKWPSEKPPPDADPNSERWLPLGDAAAVGVFKNCFGDASALVRRATFEVLGGFTEDGGVGHEDWELWARAVLRGYKLRVVPEALYWYRVGGRGSMLAESIGGTRLAQAQRHANHARNIRPYLQRLRGWPEAQDAVRLAQGMYLEAS